MEFGEKKKINDIFKERVKGAQVFQRKMTSINNGIKATPWKHKGSRVLQTDQDGWTTITRPRDANRTSIEKLHLKIQIKNWK